MAVLDWEFAHLADPVEDLAWPLVRAWRFGADDRHLGGIGELEPYVRYAELTGVEARPRSCSPGRCSATSSGQRLPHPVAAPPQRPGALGRARRARPARRRDGVRAARPDRTCCMTAPPRRSSPRRCASSSRTRSCRSWTTTGSSSGRWSRSTARDRRTGALGDLAAARAGLELARRIRAGDVPADAVAVLKEQVAQKLRVSNLGVWRSTKRRTDEARAGPRKVPAAPPRSPADDRDGPVRGGRPDDRGLRQPAPRRRADARRAPPRLAAGAVSGRGEHPGDRRPAAGRGEHGRPRPRRGLRASSASWAASTTSSRASPDTRSSLPCSARRTCSSTRTGRSSRPPGRRSAPTPTPSAAGWTSSTRR